MADEPANPTDSNQSQPRPAGNPDAQNAIDLIRQKVARVYGAEPSAQQELAEANAARRPSKHQQFMQALSESGKDLATIQTEWHNYYQNLPEEEKHQVWQEFYESQPALRAAPTQPDQTDIHTLAKHKHEAARPRHKLRDARSADEVQAALRDRVSAGGKLQAKHHLQSLLFGLGVGAIVLIIFLFGFFNEVVIAPFIQPSRTSASTPLIVSSNDISPTAKPEVIIPKINVEIPVDYSQKTTNEATIENALESGVVHYPTTARPGQNGNAAFFGHSSNNIFNRGKYKFAFVLLHTLQKDDTFYLTYKGRVYAYKVISKTIVQPNQVGVLGPVPGVPATATLITCDPPGTSLHRLVVVGEQVSPNPSGNSEASVTPIDASNDLPGNGPTLWSRFIGTGWGKAVAVGALVVMMVVTIRWVEAPKRHVQQAAKDRQP